MSTILSINNYYYARGGADILFLEHNNIMEHSGWEVIPFSMRHSKNLASNWEGYFIDEIEFGRRYSLWQKAKMASKVIYSFEARNNLERLLKKYNVDICHAHNIYHHISPSILSLIKQHDIPVIMSLHDLKLACPAYKMLTGDGVCERCKGGKFGNLIRYKCIKGSLALSLVVYFETVLHRLLNTYIDNVSQFIVPSRLYFKKFVEWGLDEDKLVYIPNFIQLDRFCPTFQVGEGFLYFGRLSHEKGLETLIRACAKACVSLRIVGTGPDEMMLKKLSSELNAEVEFLGFKSGEDLHKEILNCRAVVLPSEWYENAPLSILESYALGKPVLAAQIGGIPELVKNYRTGLLFTSGSSDDLATKLSFIVNLPDADIREMGYMGREWVENDFSQGMYKERIFNLYSDYLS